MENTSPVQQEIFFSICVWFALAVVLMIAATWKKRGSWAACPSRRPMAQENLELTHSAELSTRITDAGRFGPGELLSRGNGGGALHSDLSSNPLSAAAI